MILVTLGTQKEQFKRLLDYIEKSNIKDRIVVQAGHTKYESDKLEIYNFFNYDTMEKLVDMADLIITHGGTGSIVEPLKKGKKIIACSRLPEYGEHIDNHQEELVKKFSEGGYILELDKNNNLDDLFEISKEFTPNIYESNTENFIKKLEKKMK